MKKQFVIVISFLLVLVLSACGNGKSDPLELPSSKMTEAASEETRQFADINGVWKLRPLESTTEDDETRMGWMQYFEFNKNAGSTTFRSTFCPAVSRNLSVDLETGPTTIGYTRYESLKGDAEITDTTVRMQDRENAIIMNMISEDKGGYRVQVIWEETKEGYDTRATEFEAYLAEITDLEELKLAGFQLDHPSINPVVPNTEQIWKGYGIKVYPVKEKNRVYAKIAEGLPIITDCYPVIIEKDYDESKGLVLHADYDYNLYPVDENAVEMYFGYNGDGIVTENVIDMVFLVCYLKESVNFCAEYSYVVNQHAVSAYYQGSWGWYTVGDEVDALPSRISIFGEMGGYDSDTAIGSAVNEYNAKNDTELAQHFVPVYPFVNGMLTYNQVAILEFGDSGQVQKVYNDLTGKLVFKNE